MTRAEIEKEFLEKIRMPSGLDGTGSIRYASAVWIKYVISALVNPKSIVEIGVSRGYGAWGMLKASPEAEYTGVDSYSSGYHGCGKNAEKEFHEWALKVLAPFKAEIVVSDSRAKGLRIPCADLYHVDGNHTRDYVVNDLELCLREGCPDSVIVIHDYTAGEVQAGVKAFQTKYGAHTLSEIKSFWGDGVLTCGLTPKWIERAQEAVDKGVL